MRISFFNYHYDIEGTARGAAVQIRSIAEALQMLGHEVDLHFRAARKPGRERAYGGMKKIPWLRRYANVPRLILRNFHFYREECRLIAEFRPDVVLAAHSYCNLSAVTAARRCGVPCVVLAETPMEYEYSMFFTPFYSYPVLGRWLEGMNIRSASQVICISEILKGYMMRYAVPATRLHVIPNGVDHHLIRPVPPDEDLRHRFGLTHRRVVGFVGTFQFFGNVDATMEIIEKVCGEMKDVVFLFVGEGEAGKCLRDKGERMGLGEHLLFTGAVTHEEVPSFLSVMDVVFASYRGDYLFYGSPMKLLEYMAAGKAVLGTALGQIKELIVDGYNGMLFEWGDNATMYRKLLSLLQDPALRRKLGDNARKTIEENWTWEIQASHIVEVLQKALGAKP